MSFSKYDFNECRKQVQLPSPIKKMLRGWGGSPEGGGSWTGGFVLQLEDDQYAYLSGWCDYTGWG